MDMKKRAANKSKLAPRAPLSSFHPNTLTARPKAKLLEQFEGSENYVPTPKKTVAPNSDFLTPKSGRKVLGHKKTPPISATGAERRKQRKRLQRL